MLAAARTDVYLFRSKACSQVMGTDIFLLKDRTRSKPQKPLLARRELQLIHHEEITRASDQPLPMGETRASTRSRTHEASDPERFRALWTSHSHGNRPEQVSLSFPNEHDRFSKRSPPTVFPVTLVFLLPTPTLLSSSSTHPHTRVPTQAPPSRSI